MGTTTTIEKFLRDLPGSEKTRETYGWGLKLFATIVGETAVLDAEAYKKFLLDTKDMHPGTQQTYRAAVRALLTELDVSPNLLNRYTKRYGQKPGKRLPKYDEPALDQLIAYADTLTGSLQDLRDRALILTLCGSGLRIHEACGLLRGDIDWKARRAVLIGKGNKEAVVRFSDRSLAAIQDYLRARGGKDGATGRALETLPLFARHDKGGDKGVKPLGTKGAWFTFKQRLKEAGVDPRDVRVHDTRHFFVTSVLRKNGGNLAVAQELARHESPKTTIRYVHLTNSELDSAFDRAVNV